MTHLLILFLGHGEWEDDQLAVGNKSRRDKLRQTMMRRRRPDVPFLAFGRAG